jgi:hypothetical protein
VTPLLGRGGGEMKKFIGATLLCVSIAALCGCAVYKSKSKDTGAKKEREVKVLGIPIVETKEKVDR